MVKRTYLLLLLIFIYLPIQSNAEPCTYYTDGSPITREEFDGISEVRPVDVLFFDVPPSLFDVADCTAEGSTSSKRDNRVYAGLVWTFGKTKNTFVPDISLGYSSLKVKSDSDLNGFDASVRIGLSGQGIKLDSTRVSYVDGDRSLMTQYGVGYSFSHSDFLATVAAQKSHLRLGADLLLSSQMLVPYIEINSLDKPDKNSSSSCDGRFLPNGALGDNPGDVGHLNEDGSTCANNPMTLVEHTMSSGQYLGATYDDENLDANISQLWLAGEGEYMIVTTATEAGIDNAIASKQQDGYTYSGNKHYSESNQHWVANFSKEN